LNGTVEITPKSVYIGVTPTGLSPGASTGSVTVSPVGGRGDHPCDVHFTVTNAPTLVASPTSLSFTLSAWEHRAGLSSIAAGDRTE
jgi:hypothetical protein